MSSRRQLVMGVCVLLAAAVNAAALGAADRWAGQRVSMPAAAGTATNRPTALLLVAHGAAAAAPPVAHNPQPQPPEIDTAAPAALKRLPPPAPAQPLLADDETAPELPEPMRFYTYTEVDRPAWPVTDWPLDVHALDAAGIERLVFEVMVSDRGDVLGCAILHPIALNEAVRTWLERLLAATPMEPAMRDGELVASVRRIELVVEAVP